MRRVEVVVKVDRKRVVDLGASWVLRKLDKGDLLDVSMGTKVPFDLETVSADYEAYNRALATYDPKVHKSPAHAVLLYHKVSPIRGLSITRSDYTELGKYSLNKIFPDGRKVMLDNTFPRFFDISAVFIGAEPPAKSMLKLATKCDILGTKCGGQCLRGKCAQYQPSGALLHDLEYKEGLRMSKTAADKQKTALVSKKGTIAKDVGSTFNPKAMGVGAQKADDLPASVLDEMAQKPLEGSLSTSGLSGIPLKPHELQRIVLIKMDKRDLADGLDEQGKVFAPTDAIAGSSMINHDWFLPSVFRMLRDFLPMRSALPPFQRAPGTSGGVTVIIASKPRTPERGELLDKISAAYNGYRKDLLDSFVKEADLTFHQNLQLRNELYKYAEDFTLVDDETLEALRVF